MTKLRIQRSKKYKAWYKNLTEKEKGIVDTRLDMYVERGLLINIKSLAKEYSLYEFKWNSGLRVYFSFLEDSEGHLILLLLGGNKNSQVKDIAEEKNFLKKVIIRIEEKM